MSKFKKELYYHVYLDNYTIVSIATTGIYANTDDILEICAIRVRNGIITNIFKKYIYYEDIKINNYTTEMNGITEEVIIKNGEPLHLVYIELLNFLGTDTIIFNHLEFVCSFIFRDIQLIFDNYLVDLYVINQLKFFNKLEWFGAEEIAKYCNFFEYNKKNGAYNTALATYKIYEYLKIDLSLS